MRVYNNDNQLRKIHFIDLEGACSIQHSYEKKKMAERLCIVRALDEKQRNQKGWCQYLFCKISKIVIVSTSVISSYNNMDNNSYRREIKIVIKMFHIFLD